jgi:hypothetical protein
MLISILFIWILNRVMRLALLNGTILNKTLNKPPKTLKLNGFSSVGIDPS